MRSLQLVGALALSLVVGACAGGSSSDDVAACMQAMATVRCPPGTAPASTSGGDSSTDIGADVTGIGATNLQNIGCDYECAPICQCGIERVEGDGGVVCSPCYGAEFRALADGAAGVLARPAEPSTPAPYSQTVEPAGPTTIDRGAAPSVMLDFNAQPLYGHRSLSAPFHPDPFEINVEAGGNEAIADAAVYDPTGGACRGYVNARQPDVSITYSSRGTPLTMSVQSDADTTLVVNLPDGTWRCNDDANGNTLNPLLYFADGMSGRYDVWIGTYRQDSTFPPARFRISARN